MKKHTNLLQKTLLATIVLMSYTTLFANTSQKVKDDSKYTLCTLADYHGLSELGDSDDGDLAQQRESLQKSVSELRDFGNNILKILNSENLFSKTGALNGLNGIADNLQAGGNQIAQLYSAQAEILKIIYEKLRNFHSDHFLTFNVAYIPESLCVNSKNALKKLTKQAVSTTENAITSIQRGDFGGKNRVSVHTSEVINIANLDKLISKPDDESQTKLVGFSFYITYDPNSRKSQDGEPKRQDSNPYEMTISGGVVVRMSDNFHKDFNKNLELSEDPNLNFILKDVKFKDGEKEHKFALLNMENIVINKSGLHPYSERTNNYANASKENLKFNLEFTDKINFILQLNTRRHVFVNNKGKNPLVATLENEECKATGDCNVVINPFGNIYAKIDQLILELRPKIIEFKKGDDIIHSELIYLPSPRAPDKSKREKGWIGIVTNWSFIPIKLNMTVYGRNLINTVLDLVTDEILSTGAAHASYYISLYNYFQKNICNSESDAKVEIRSAQSKDSVTTNDQNRQQPVQVSCNVNLQQFTNKISPLAISPE